MDLLTFIVNPNKKEYRDPEVYKNLINGLYEAVRNYTYSDLHSDGLASKLIIMESTHEFDEGTDEIEKKWVLLTMTYNHIYSRAIWDLYQKNKGVRFKELVRIIEAGIEKEKEVFESEFDEIENGLGEYLSEPTSESLEDFIKEQIVDVNRISSIKELWIRRSEVGRLLNLMASQRFPLALNPVFRDGYNFLLDIDERVAELRRAGLKES